MSEPVIEITAVLESSKTRGGGSDEAELVFRGRVTGSACDEAIVGHHEVRGTSGCEALVKICFSDNPCGDGRIDRAGTIGVLEACRMDCRVLTAGSESDAVTLSIELPMAALDPILAISDGPVTWKPTIGRGQGLRSIGGSCVGRDAALLVSAIHFEPAAA